MAEALHLRGNERVLEIGTGSGYQTAILSCLGDSVCSLERLPQFVDTATSRLRQMGYGNVDVRQGTSLRWPDGGPFDAIHVSAAVPEVPGVLFAQLAPGGRLVLPVGRSPHQRLLLFVRKGSCVSSVSLGACRFQPLRGRAPAAP
jgi:protein-L-isoaspartate(D-aspartate) O-methyltransferase